MIRAIALLAVLVLACQPIPPPLPPTPDGDSSTPPLPPEVPDAAPDGPQDAPADFAAPRDARPDLTLQGPACDQFCAVLDWVGCPEGRPTPGGISCADVCEGVHQFALKDFERTLTSATKCRDVACVRKAGVRCK